MLLTLQLMQPKQPTIIQIGMAKGDAPVLLQKFLAKELTYRGAFRFTLLMNLKWQYVG